MGAGLHIAEIHHFHRCMNVAARDRNATGLDAVPGNMDRSGIRSAGSQDIFLGLNALRRSQFIQSLNDLGVTNHRRIHHFDGCPVAQLYRSAPFRAGGVIHVGHIDGNGIIRLNCPGGGTGSADANLLLRSQDKIQDVNGAFKPLQNSTQHQSGNTVILLG